MSEVKNFLIIIIIFVLCNFGCFCWGYILSNRKAIEQLDKANQQLAEEQQRYDNLIRESKERIREAEQRVSNIRTELLGKVSDNGETTKELSAIIEEIRKQRIDI